MGHISADHRSFALRFNQRLIAKPSDGALKTVFEAYLRTPAKFVRGPCDVQKAAGDVNGSAFVVFDFDGVI